MYSLSSFLYRLKKRLSLAYRILRIHYFQPATALFRVFELEVVLENLKGEGKGLDLGCGDGSLSSIIFPHFPQVKWTGLDIDPVDTELARKSDLYEKVHTVSGTRIPEPGDTFDLIFSNSVLEHVDDLDGVLDEAVRVLKPGGSFIFTVPHDLFHYSLFWPKVLRFFNFQKTADKYLSHLDARSMHLNYLSIDEWKRKLSSKGLRLSTEIQYLSKRACGWWETLSNSTGGVVYVLSRKRVRPRQFQQRSGILKMPCPWIGTILFVLMLPVFLLTFSEKVPREPACIYIEAFKPR